MIPFVIEQHADDAAFLRVLRDVVADAPHVSLADLCRHDERVEAHLDGLRVAGDAGWDACAEALADGEPGAVFVAGVLAFEHSAEKRARTVLNAVHAAPALARSATSALGWVSAARALSYGRRLSDVDDPVLRRVGLGAFVAHRYDPERALDRALGDDDAALVAYAVRAAGEIGRVDLLPLIRERRTVGDPVGNFEAAWAVALLAGDADAIATLVGTVETPDEDPRIRERALQLVIRRLRVDSAGAWVRRLSRDPALLHDAIVAAGALGDPTHVPWLLDLMEMPPLARVAGEAFTTLSGADLSAERLATDAPADFQAGPTENPDDENVAMDPDEELPWPDVPRVRDWWAQRAGQFTPGRRYLLGTEYGDAWLAHVLRHGLQRQRAAAALELAIRHPGTPLFEVRAPGFRQRAMLGV